MNIFVEKYVWIDDRVQNKKFDTIIGKSIWIVQREELDEKVKK